MGATKTTVAGTPVTGALNVNLAKQSGARAAEVSVPKSELARLVRLAEAAEPAMNWFNPEGPFASVGELIKTARELGSKSDR